MINTFKTVFTRSETTFASDAIGAAALVVMLVVGLSLPGLA